MKIERNIELPKKRVEVPLAGAIGGSYLKSNKVLFGKRFAIRQVSGGVRVWRKK